MLLTKIFKTNIYQYKLILILVVITFSPSFSQIEDVEINDPINNQIVTTEDIKYYRIQITGTEPFFIHLSKPTKWTSGFLVYQGSMNHGANYSSGAGSDDHMVEVENVVPGIYYIKLQGYSNLPGDYTLIVKSSLDTLTINQNQTGQIKESFNTFWYQIKITDSTPFFIHLSKPTKWTSGFLVYQGSMNHGANYSSGAGSDDHMVEVENVVPGIYYIRLEGYSDLPGDYTLIVKSQLDTLTINQSQTGQIKQSFNIVWYQIKISDTALFSIHLEKPTKWTSGFLVYQGSMNHGANYSSGTWSDDNMVIIENVIPGIYYIRLAGYSNLPGNYKLTVKQSLPNGIDNYIINKIPNNFYISQNYPNPFNSLTNIQFNVKKQCFVSLNVYNLKGQKITMLVNSIYQAGEYKVVFNANNISTGNYFYTIEMGNFQAVKRMEFLK